MHWRASDLVDALASQQRVGLIFVDEYGHRRDYSFAEIAKHSQQYAAVLRAFGVQQDDTVYLALSTSAKTIFALLALQRLGAGAVFEQAQSAQAKAVITNREYRSRIEELRESFSPDARYIIIGEEREGWARLDTLAQIATPAAGVEFPRDDEGLEAARAASYAALGAVSTDTVWCALQISDPAWFESAIARAWLLGAAAVVHNGAFDARERLDLVRELDVTILLQRTDDFHAELALPDPKRFKMPRLRRCIALDDGAEELLQQQWMERFGVQLSAPSLLTQRFDHLG